MPINITFIREWSGNSFAESGFQFKNECRDLPPAYISPTATLLASVQTVPRDAAQQVLNFLTDSYFQECPTGKVHYSTAYAK